MEQLNSLKVVLQIAEDDVAKDKLLQFYLDVAKTKILERLYPLDDKKTELPDKYLLRQIEIAVYLYNKQGAEGQIVHGENGIMRTYESSDVPESLMRGITPFVGVVS